MKKTVFRLAGIIALIAVIGFAMAACDDGSGKTEGSGNGSGTNADPALNGTWGVGNNGTYLEWIFNNGNLDVSMNNAPYEKATYTTAGNKLTFKITHIYGKNDYIDNMEKDLNVDFQLQAQWYTITEFFSKFKTAYLKTGGTEKEWAEGIEPMIKQAIGQGTVYTYSVNGNVLTLILDLSQVGQSGTQTITMTKK